MNIRWSLLALVAGIVLTAQGVSYWLTRELLSTSVSQHETEKVNAVAGIVASLVHEYTRSAQLAARTLGSSERLAQALRNPDAPYSRDTFNTMLKPLLAEGDLEIVEIVDPREIVRYRAQGMGLTGDKADAWGVSEALTGKGSLVAHATPRGTAVFAIEPIRDGKRITGAVITGRRLNDSFIRNLSQKVGAELALASRGQILASSSDLALGELDPTAVEEAFAQKIPIYRNTQDRLAKVVYVPVLIVDEGFVMMVRVDSSMAMRALIQNLESVLRWTAGLLVFCLLIATFMLRIVLRPLRALRHRANQTAITATGAPIESHSADEIGAVVHVLDTLTGRLLEQNRALGLSQTEAEAANAAKSQFLANMSHEIRTPLNGVLGMSELLQGTELTADQRRYSDAIATSGRALHELLSNILDLSKIEAGKVEIEAMDFDLTLLLRDLAAAYRELGAGRSNGLLVEHALPSQYLLRGDPTRLRQVLSNLLGNAIKFTQAGTITLGVATLAPHSGDARAWLRFSVRDTGIGIAPENLKSLFKPFTQADSSTTRRYGGTGLGLVICKHLVELLGGSMEVESVPGTGTCFSFELPFAAAQNSAQAAPAGGAVQPRQITARVLLAEDNPVNQEVIKAILGKAGAEVLAVDNGELAVQALRQREFDVVLMDCQMPVMSGYEATKLIRAEAAPGARRLPIIALTANAFAEDRERCLAAGMDDYLTKPVQRDLLVQTIQRWITQAAPRAPALTPPASPPASSNTFDQSVIDQLSDAIGRPSTAKVLRMYLSNAPTELTTLQEIHERKDLATFGARLHAMKSSTRALGGIRLADLALEGERLARAGDPAAFALHDAISEALAEFCRALEAQDCLREGAAATAVSANVIPLRRVPQTGT